MISDIHLTGTTHCPERVFTTHNSTPHERKISTQNMTAKGTCNMIDNILVDIETLRYTTLHMLCWLFYKISKSLPFRSLTEIYHYFRCIHSLSQFPLMCMAKTSKLENGSKEVLRTFYTKIR